MRVTNISNLFITSTLKSKVYEMEEKEEIMRRKRLKTMTMNHTIKVAFWGDFFFSNLLIDKYTSPNIRSMKNKGRNKLL